MKKRSLILITLILALALLFSMSACGNKTTASSPAPDSTGGNVSDSPEFIFKIGHDMKEDHPYHVFCTTFKQYVEEKSEGRIQINIYPNAMLGSETEMTEGLRLGTLDFLVSTTANSAALVPQLGILGMPFLYQSVAHARAVCADEDILAYWQEVVDETDVGLQLLNIAASGWRNIYSTFPVEKLDDIKGQNLRCQAAEIEAKIWTALGANTVTMTFSEIYTAFQTDLIVMAENCATSYYGNAHNEVAPYFSQTEHTLMIHPIMASEQAMDKLDDSLKAIIYDAAAVAGEALFDAQTQMDADNLQAAIDSGVTYIPDVDMSAAYEAAYEYHLQYAKDLNAEDALQAILALA